MLTMIISALCVGMIFGFLLQKGSVTQFNTIVGQFLFKNMIVAEIISYALLFGGLFFYSIAVMGSAFGLHAALPISAGSMPAAFVGGLIFGCGMALFGYCPGTGIAAFGQGSMDAGFGLLGMTAGAVIFERFYEQASSIMSANRVSDVLIPVNLLGLFMIAGLLCLLPIVFRILRRKIG